MMADWRVIKACPKCVAGNPSDAQKCVRCGSFLPRMSQEDVQRVLELECTRKAEERGTRPSLSLDWLLRDLFREITEERDRAASREASVARNTQRGIAGLASRQGSGEWDADDQSRALAAALWLIDRAHELLRSLFTAPGMSPAAFQRLPVLMLEAFSEEVRAPADTKLALIGRLMSQLAETLKTSADRLPEDALVGLAEDTSDDLLLRPWENSVLSWIMRIETRTDDVPLNNRLSSFCDLLRGLGAHHPSESALNEWAYFLLLVGKWKAATPMATQATKIARLPHNLDTLGWAYRYEGDTATALELISEALDQRDAKQDPDLWAEVAYHKLCVLLDIGMRDAAGQLLDNIGTLAPGSYWTKKAQSLEPLCGAHMAKPAALPGRAAASFKYDVAISFAGEDRACAEEIARRLNQRGVRVFYDEFAKAELWGKNLYSYLTEVYQSLARFCIVLVSQHYARKRWTRLEREAAQARAFSADNEYILPVLLDDTPIPGLLPTVAFLDWKREGVEGVARCFLKKLHRNV